VQELESLLKEKDEKLKEQAKEKEELKEELEKVNKKLKLTNTLIGFITIESRTHIQNYDNAIEKVLFHLAAC
jgi:hypothetical protein